MKFFAIFFLGSLSSVLGQSPTCVDVSDTGNPPVTTIANSTNTCFNSPGYPATILPRRRCAWRFQAPAGTKLALTCPVNMKHPHGKLWHRDNVNSAQNWASGSGTYTHTFSGNDATVGFEGRRPSDGWPWTNNANAYWNRAGPGFTCCIIANP